MRRREPVVAIDGPAGAGKSTVSRAVASRLGFPLLDTGALYRCVALAAKREAVSWDDADGVARVAAALSEQNAIAFETAPSGEARVILAGEDVSAAIRTQDMGGGASKVSAVPEVRAALLAVQRQVAERGGVVLEGRDIGSVVVPDAEAKFFLTASVQARAERRYLELVQRGETPTLEAVRAEVLERDERDSSRPVAPLLQAPDAELIDSTALSVDAVVDQIVSRVRALSEGPR